MAVISQTVAKFALAVTAFAPLAQITENVYPGAGSVAFSTYAPTPDISSSFPYVADTGTGRSAASNTTTFTILDPAVPLSNAAPGDLLVAIFSNDGNATVSIDTGYSGSNWSQVGTALNGTAVRGTVFKKTAESSNALRVTTSASEQGSWITFAIRNGNSLASASANGSSTNSNPPSLTPPGGTQKYLWIATRSGDSTVIPTVQPSGFSTLVNIPSAGTGGASTSASYLAEEGSTKDPGTFTVTTEQWVSFTLAVWRESAEVFPNKATLAFTGHAPTADIGQSYSGTPGTASLSFTSYPPVGTGGTATSIQVLPFSYTFTTYAPSVPAPVSQGIQVPHGYLALNNPHATVYWTAPTLNEDNSQLTDLAGYKVYYGTSLGTYGTPITVDPSTTYQVIRFPTAGTWFVQISAFNSGAEESALSDPLTLDVPSNTYAPNPHNGLTQIGGGDFTLATPTLSGSGTVGRRASGTISPPLSFVDSVAVLRHTGTGAMSPALPDITGVGLNSSAGIPGLFSRYTTYSGGDANTLGPRLIYDLVQAINGDGTPTVNPATVSGVGHRGLEWMGSPVEIEAPDFTLSGEGTIGLKVVGTGVLSLPNPVLEVSASLGHTGSGELSLVAPTLASGAKRGYVTDVSLTTLDAIFYGQGNFNETPPTPTITGDGTLEVPVVTIVGVGTKNKPGATYFGGGTMPVPSAFVESFADLIPRLNLSVSVSLFGPPVYVDGESERHLTITGTGGVSPSPSVVNGFAIRPPLVSGSGNLIAPSPVISGGTWGPTFTPDEPWSPVDPINDPWTPVNTQSEAWNG